MRRLLVILMLGCVVTAVRAQPVTRGTSDAPEMRGKTVLKRYVDAAVARQRNRGTPDDAQAIRGLIEANTATRVSEWGLAERAGDILRGPAHHVSNPHGVAYLLWQRRSVDAPLSLELLIVGEARSITALAGAAPDVRNPTNDTSNAWKIALAPVILSFAFDKEKRDRIDQLLPRAGKLIETLCFGTGTREEKLRQLADLQRKLLHDAATPQAPPTSGTLPLKPTEILGHWRFENGVQDHGPRRLPTTNHGATLTKQGPITFSRGPDYVDLGTAIGTSPFSIGFWIKPERKNGFARIISNIDPGTGGGFVIRHYQDREPDAIVFTLYAGRTAVAGAQAPLRWNQWQHITCTWDGRSVAIYRDGQRQAQFTAESLPTPSSRPVTLGGKEPDDDFIGELDDLLIVRRALTAGEIKTLAAQGRPIAD